MQMKQVAGNFVNPNLSTCAQNMMENICIGYYKLDNQTYTFYIL